MQLLEQRDKVRLTYAHENNLLHEMLSGAFQLGSGEDGKIVESLEQVAIFPEHIQARVKAYLDRGGVAEAKQEIRARDMADTAAKHPGALDAMVLEYGGQELVGEVFDMLKAMLEKRGQVTPATEPAQGQVLREGKLVVNPETGNREFVPNDDVIEDIVKREHELDRQIAAGTASAEDVAPGGVMPPADEPTMIEGLQKAKDAHRRKR